MGHGSIKPAGQLNDKTFRWTATGGCAHALSAAHSPSKDDAKSRKIAFSIWHLIENMVHHVSAPSGRAQSKSPPCVMFLFGRKKTNNFKYQ